jgi:hypothetical protein
VIIDFPTRPFGQRMSTIAAVGAGDGSGKTYDIALHVANRWNDCDYSSAVKKAARVSPK